MGFNLGFRGWVRKPRASWVWFQFGGLGSVRRGGDERRDERNGQISREDKRLSGDRSSTLIPNWCSPKSAINE